MKKDAEITPAQAIVQLITRFGKEIGRYRGQVIEIGPIDSALPDGIVRVKFEEGGKKFLRTFPKERVAAIRAVFLGAEIEYALYGLDSLTVSTLQYVGPSAEELMKRKPEALSDADMRTLEDAG